MFDEKNIELLFLLELFIYFSVSKSANLCNCDLFSFSYCFNWSSNCSVITETKIVLILLYCNFIFPQDLIENRLFLYHHSIDFLHYSIVWFCWHNIFDVFNCWLDDCAHFMPSSILVIEDDFVFAWPWTDRTTIRCHTLPGNCHCCYFCCHSCGWFSDLSTTIL